MKYIFLAILFIFSILLVYSVIKSKKETFTSPKKLISPNIVFFGNYNFHQPNNIKYPSLKELIHKKFPLANIKVITSDCFKINNISSSLSKIPLHWNNKNTTIIISVGSNDIYKNIINCSSKKNVKGADKNLDCIATTEIYNNWKKSLDIILERFKNTHIIILGTYIPKDNKDLIICSDKINTTSDIKSDLDYWNTNLSEYCKNKHINFIPVDKIIKPSDLESDGITITPSSFKKLSNILVTDISSQF